MLFFCWCAVPVESRQVSFARIAIQAQSLPKSSLQATAMPRNCYIKSPLNYTGGKYRLLNRILPAFPQEYDRFWICLPVVSMWASM